MWRLYSYLLFLPTLSYSFLSQGHAKASNRATGPIHARNFQPPEEQPRLPPNAIVNEFGGQLFTVELPKRAGINWGADLSFSWVFVSSLESGGEAAQWGYLQKGDYLIGMGNESMIAKDFDFVLSVSPLLFSSFH